MFVPFREALPRLLSSLDKPPRSFDRRLQKKLFSIMGKKPKKICFYCGRKCGGKRYNWCSDDCVQQYKLQTNDPHTLAEKILERDHGQCSRCGLDCVDAKIRLGKTSIANITQYPELHKLLPIKYRDSDLRRLTFTQLADLTKFMDRRMWEIDHITGVWEGGGLCGLENLQTLCVDCHRQKTANDKLRQTKQRS